MRPIPNPLPFDPLILAFVLIIVAYLLALIKLL